jgi:hypothetical protein
MFCGSLRTTQQPENRLRHCRTRYDDEIDQAVDLVEHALPSFDHALLLSDASDLYSALRFLQQT